MSVPSGFFDDLYRRESDPWGFRTKWYERRKYALTLAALTRQRYGTGLELGCSIGVFTRALAARCDELLAVDGSQVALDAAREHLGAATGVRLQQLELPAGWPGGRFDLVVFSEIGYFLSPADLATTIDHIAGSLSDGGEVVAVHWRPPGDVYTLNGDRVHEALRAHDGLRSVASYAEESFLLDVLTRA